MSTEPKQKIDPALRHKWLHARQVSNVTISKCTKCGISKLTYPKQFGPQLMMVNEYKFNALSKDKGASKAPPCDSGAYLRHLEQLFEAKDPILVEFVRRVTTPPTLAVINVVELVYVPDIADDSETKEAPKTDCE